jgi:hypothetical protein
MGNDPVNNVDPDGGSIFEGVGLGARTAVGALAGAIVGVAAAAITGNEDDSWKWAGYGALIGGGLTYALSSPLYVNVQFVPTWGQVQKDIKSHNGKFSSAYLAAKLRSFVNEVFSLGKIVTITGDGFVPGKKYIDENNVEQTSKGTLSLNLIKYFDRHPLAKGVANAITEFHSSNMGYIGNLGAQQFSSISKYFTSQSTFLYGNCFQGDRTAANSQPLTDTTSNALNGATVIGSHTQQLDLPYLFVGRLSGNPMLASSQSGLVAKPGDPLKADFMMHRVSKNGMTIYNGRAETKVMPSGRVIYRKLSDTQARTLNDRYFRLKSNVFKNILSLIRNGN